MDELHIGKASAYEKEARELIERLKCKGVILIVIQGEREGADHYEVASAIKGGMEIMVKIPFFLVTLADRFMDDVRKFLKKDSQN